MAGQTTHMNAADLLRNDHHRVKTLFEDFHHAANDDEKKDIVRETCNELKVHTILEEEIFYPAARKKVQDKALVEHALEEHRAAKHLIADLEGMTPEDEDYDAKFNALADAVLHHIDEEEGDMIPEVESMDIDLDALGEEMAERKEELMSRGAAAPKRGRGRR